MPLGPLLSCSSLGFAAILQAQRCIYALLRGIRSFLTPRRPTRIPEIGTQVFEDAKVQT